MKKLLVILGGALLLAYTPVSAQVQTQGAKRKCGFDKLRAHMIATNPTFAEKFAAQKAAMQGIADNYKAIKQSGAAQRTTGSTTSAVPIIFHIEVDSAQFISLGGTAGIAQRCDSQIAVLNHDYNHENADSTLIPSGWNALYGTAGIQFGLARIDPNGDCSPGYEIKIIPGTGLTDAGFADDADGSGAYTSAKSVDSGGLNAWDVTKYYNVWCINFTDDDQLLGITVPKSFVGFGIPSTDEGVCIHYNTLGSTGGGTIPVGTGTWPTPYNLGRTLTHETGHFFEIWHPWGDDGGGCPWNGGADDGLTDTPPESDAEYGNPAYTITGGTLNDGCKINTVTSANTQPIGIACLSYMDYTDDNAMHLFTPDQAAVMASMALVPAGSAGTTSGEGTVGENYSLTQHPELLVGCATAVPTVTEANGSLDIFPNPTTGTLSLVINSGAQTLNTVQVINLIGQQVMAINGQNKDYYSIDLSGMSKGIYFIKCNFTSGSITRKILLQ